MRPKRIILVRHGESEGNADTTKAVYASKPDFALNLSSKGRQQAYERGWRLKHLLGSENVWFYRSPFYRTRQTHEEIVGFFPESRTHEDPRLREQEWSGRLEPRRGKEIEEERDAYGHFYYRFHGGESCADVYDRVSDFLSTLYRDFEKPEFPDNCVIVGHGMTNRVFLMRILHYTVEQFEFLRNPQNCGVYVLERYEITSQSLVGRMLRWCRLVQRRYKFRLVGEPERYAERNCKY